MATLKDVIEKRNAPPSYAIDHTYIINSVKRLELYLNYSLWRP